VSQIVVDASVLGPLIVPDERDELIPLVFQALSAGNAVAPQHWRLEVANLARMAVRRGRLNDDALVPVFADLRDMIVEVDSQTDRCAWAETLELSRRHDLTAYDAAYLELALRSGLALATRDGRLARAATAEGVALISA